MGTFMSTFFTATNPACAMDTNMNDEFIKGLKAQVAVERLEEAANQTLPGILPEIPSSNNVTRKESNIKIEHWIEARSTENGALEEHSSSSKIPSRTSSRRLTQSHDSVNGNNIRSGSKKSLDFNRNPSPTFQPATNTSTSNAPKQQKPFQPESWPTEDILQKHLQKRESPPTTFIVARFMPHRSLSRKYVEIQYSTCDTSNETVLETSEKIDTLIAPKDEYKMGNTKEEEIKYFQLIFKTCINNLQGQVWWNGYSIIWDKSPINRLKIDALETKAISQLLFDLSGMKELEVHRQKDYCMELRGIPERVSEGQSYRYIRFRGLIAKDIKVEQLRGNLITVHLPGFAMETLNSMK